VSYIDKALLKDFSLLGKHTITYDTKYSYLICSSKSTQKISRPFTEMMQRRIEYRKKLLEYLNSGGDENDDAKAKADRRERRYRRYIQHGIGTEHIAPLQQLSINHILALIPNKLKKNFKEFLQSLLSEVQQEFIVGVKIAVVEYVLHDAKQSKLDTSNGLNSSQRAEQSIAARARKQKTQKTQLYIRRNLHIINKCVAQVLDLWHKSFRYDKK
jgi:dynein heavy chain